MKKIKGSKRGLTFTLEDQKLIGTKFRYIIDTKNNEILIIADVDGTGTVSRKKCGKDSFKPLYDIRSKEVKDLVSDADYLQIETDGDIITVHVYRKISQAQIASKSNVIRIEDVFAEKTGEVVLKKVSGDSFSEHIYSCSANKVSPEKELHNVYDVLSLFSGAGMLDYSFLDPQFRFVYAVDFDPDACLTYRENIGPHIQCRDIRDVSADEIPSADVILGGPCCQAFSCSNRHMDNMLGTQGEQKRELISDYIRIVKGTRPRVFVIENVPSILTAGQGHYLEQILTELSEYTITHKIVCDNEHGGFSTRKRAIIIGSTIGRIELPDAELCPVRTVREALEKVDASWYNYEDVTTPSDHTKLIMSYVPQGGNWRDVPESVHKFGPHTHSNTYRRLSMDGLSPTLANWRKCQLLHPLKNRILSVSEAAAIMGLDKNFKVLGKTLHSKQQQVCNGVTQCVGRLIKRCVLNKLNAVYAC